MVKILSDLLVIPKVNNLQLRSLVGGRYNFSVRAVIRQDASLRCDQVRLPYAALAKCLQQQIINILVRTYNINPNEAYSIWYASVANKDSRVEEIINNLIHANPEGLPVLINRNQLWVEYAA